MHFDADQFLAALEKPSFTANGHTYTGRILSFEEWVPFEGRLRHLNDLPEQAEDADATVVLAGKQYAVVRALIRDLMNAIFPPEPWWKRRGVPTAAEAFAKLPYLWQMKALTDFLRCQSAALASAATPPSGTEAMVG